MHPRETVSEYLLSGMAYCKHCGAKMIGVPAKSGKFHYYVCQNYLKRGKEVCGHVERRAGGRHVRTTPYTVVLFWKNHTAVKLQQLPGKRR